MEEMKMCPFCGGKEVEVDFLYSEDAYAVICKCGARGAKHTVMNKAIGKWNTRAEEVTNVTCANRDSLIP